MIQHKKLYSMVAVCFEITHIRETSKTGRTFGTLLAGGSSPNSSALAAAACRLPLSARLVFCRSSLASQAHTVYFFGKLEWLASSPTSFLYLSLAYAADRFCLFAI